MTKGLFEIKFVQHQDPFYQLGKLYVYKLQVELFQYASEHIDTGHKDIDVFETLKTYDVDYGRNATGSVTKVTIVNPGSGYNAKPSIALTGGGGTAAFQPAELAVTMISGAVSTIGITNTGTGYDTAPTVTIGTNWVAGGTVNTNAQVSTATRLYTATVGGTLGVTAPTHTTGAVANGTATLTYAGVRALATTSIEPVADLPQSYGDNLKFKTEASDLVFNVNNPFGEVQ